MIIGRENQSKSEGNGLQYSHLAYHKSHLTSPGAENEAVCEMPDSSDLSCGIQLNQINFGARLGYRNVNFNCYCTLTNKRNGVKKNK